MNEADLEEMHYRGQIKYMLEAFVSGQVSVEMAVPGLMLLFPVRDQGFDENGQTTLTLMLQDLAEAPNELEDTISEILGMVLDAVRHQAQMNALRAAVTALEARGNTVIQVNAFGHFRVNGVGHYSIDDILDLAEK